MVPFHDARGRLPVKFYIFALFYYFEPLEVRIYEFLSIMS
jgi:hypothetical protein